ncbi:hypothetical protein NMG60_11014206 [Bertholletia excelsa]
MASRKRSISSEADVPALHKEWDEASCPICMDHPHNAVLLICTSHEKGCKSYICDTSYRHSNCLDRFKKLQEDNTSPPHPTSPIRSQTTTYPTETHGNHSLNESDASIGLAGGLRESAVLGTGDSDGENSPVLQLNLKCPLCRGNVVGWEVVEEARRYLNTKPRSCSRESCSFFGNYSELRQHARRVHPMARPADIDPSRQRAWRRLERQREYADIVSAIHTAMPGAVVLGDFVIENGERVPDERERVSGELNRPWWTTFFLFHMIGSMDPDGEPRGRSRVLARHRRSRRQFHWGENLLGLQYDDEDNDEDADGSFANALSDAGEDGSPIPRRRRRLARPRSDEDQ